MANKSLSTTFTDPVRERLSALGERVRLARLRRQLRQEDLAERTGFSRSTIVAIERGEPTTAIGAYVQTLWVLGLDRELDLVADVGLDREGLAFEYVPGERRVRPRKIVDNDF
jgi:transcriptional regulator with XRE-family HTH domain